MRDSNLSRQSLFIKRSRKEFIGHFSPAYKQKLMRTGKIKKLKGYDKPIFRLRITKLSRHL
jgi:hypothetical protein